MPLGAQLVGPLGRDGRFLRTATALIERLAETQKTPRRARGADFRALASTPG
jgi:hypothetical protein